MIPDSGFRRMFTTHQWIRDTDDGADRQPTIPIEVKHRLDQARKGESVSVADGASMSDVRISRMRLGLRFTLPMSLHERRPARLEGLLSFQAMRGFVA